MATIGGDWGGLHQYLWEITEENTKKVIPPNLKVGSIFWIKINIIPPVWGAKILQKTYNPPHILHVGSKLIYKSIYSVKYESTLVLN